MQKKDTIVKAEASNLIISNTAVSMEEYTDKLEEQKRKFEERIKELEEKFPTPMFKEGDLALFHGYRKVRIKKIYPYSSKKGIFSSLFSKKRSWDFIYSVEECNPTPVEMVDANGVVHNYGYYDTPFYVTSEELKPLPSNYEGYLCHIIDQLREHMK